MRAVSATLSGVRHLFGVLVEGLLIVAIIGALSLAVGAVGGHPSGAAATMAKGTSAYSITVGDAAGGARVQFTYGATVGTYSMYGSADPVYVRLLCTADSTSVTNLAVGDVVYDVYRSIREGAWNTDGYAAFSTSTSPAWTGGGAACTAYLRTYVMHNANRVWKTLASTSFSVLP